MSRSEVQKIKLLALYDFLRRETDENNPLSTAEIIEGLKPDGIAVERKLKLCNCAKDFLVMVIHQGILILWMTLLSVQMKIRIT